MVRQEVEIFAESGGVDYALTNLNDGYRLSTVTGVGLADIGRLWQKGPYQIGDTDQGYTQAPRIITLGWNLQECSPRGLYNFREEVLAIFRPRVEDPIKLKFYLPNGAIRVVDCYTEGVMDYTSGDRIDPRTQGTAVVLKASDPRFYDPRLMTKTIFLNVSMAGWSIEQTAVVSANGWNIEQTGAATQNGWNIGISRFVLEDSIVYGESSRAADVEFPIIYIFGPIRNPIVENVTTGETLDFTLNGGLSLSAGQFVKIDLRYAQKTAINQVGVSVDPYLTPDSDLATWHLSYNTELLSSTPTVTRSTGTNIVRVSGFGATAVTRVEIRWYNRFIGF